MSFEARGRCDICYVGDGAPHKSWCEFGEGCEECDRKEEQLSTLLSRCEAAEGALCRARDVFAKYEKVYPRSNFVFELRDALSSSAPCPHEEELKRLREAVEWVLSQPRSYAIGTIGHLAEKRFREELRRRADK